MLFHFKACIPTHFPLAYPVLLITGVPSSEAANSPKANNPAFESFHHWIFRPLKDVSSSRYILVPTTLVEDRKPIKELVLLLAVESPEDILSLSIVQLPITPDTDFSTPPEVTLKGASANVACPS